MERYLGIDYGKKRIGLSFADSIGIAIPLPLIKVKNTQLSIKIIKATIKRYQVTKIIIGYPLNLNNSTSTQIKFVENFIAILKVNLNMPIYRVDEKLTSYQVMEDIKSIGLLKKKNKNLIKNRRIFFKSNYIDSRSACLILQEMWEHYQNDFA